MKKFYLIVIAVIFFAQLSYSKDQTTDVTKETIEEEIKEKKSNFLNSLVDEASTSEEEGLELLEHLRNLKSLLENHIKDINDETVKAQVRGGQLVDDGALIVALTIPFPIASKIFRHSYPELVRRTHSVWPLKVIEVSFLFVGVTSGGLEIVKGIAQSTNPEVTFPLKKGDENWHLDKDDVFELLKIVAFEYEQALAKQAEREETLTEF